MTRQIKFARRVGDRVQAGLGPLRNGYRQPGNVQPLFRYTLGVQAHDVGLEAAEHLGQAGDQAGAVAARQHDAVGDPAQRSGETALVGGWDPWLHLCP